MAVTESERRVVAVLMADIAGSTAIGEELGPERSKVVFDEVMRLMAAAVERFDGTVAQVAGDGLLALFGAPVAHEDDSERAVRASLAIQRSLAAYSGEVQGAYGIELRARVAVNTGPVVISPGGDAQARYNALGDTVNVAARLQALAEDSRVMLGPQTAAQVRGAFELEALGARELRGRAGPVDLFRVVGEIEPGPPPAGATLVGRNAELAAVRGALQQLVDGLGAIVSITGEPGIGKSRLLAEALGPVRDRLRVLEGRGLSYTEAFPYWPLRELLRDWLGAGVTTTEARVRLDLKAALRGLFDDADEVYPFLATMLGLTPDPESSQRLREFSRDAAHRRSVEVVAELMRGLARERPLLIVFEDLHWADQPSLDLIEGLLDLTEREPVGIVMLYRADRELGSWRVGEHARQRFPHRYREVELRPLPGEATLALVSELAEGPIPGPVSALIGERAGGNPLFAAEALCDLIERGTLRRGADGWELAVDPDTLEVPALVQAVLQARLDRLPPDAREVVAVAAVIGRRFALPLLERVADPETLPGALTDLQRLDLIVEERRRPFPEYRFRHGLVQEAAYATLTDSRRRELHGRVGEALEELAGDEPSPRTFAHLARHFTEADDGPRAVEYLIRAGDEARGMYAHQEAIRHYRRAREFLSRIGDDRRSRETLFKIALVHHLAFDFAGAERAYDEAFACKVEPADTPEMCERLVTAIPRPPEALAPGLDYVSETNALIAHLFRGLLIVDRDLNVMPSLAENFRVSADGLTYLFQLREDARWSDGEPLTAHDFVDTWERMRALSTVTAFLLEDIRSATALDDHTLEVVVHEPRNYFPYVLTNPAAYAWPRHLCDADQEWHERRPLVSSGPFVLTEMDDHGMRLAPSPHWTGARGNLEQIEIRFRRPRDEAAELWETGDFDVLSTRERVELAEDDGCAEPVPVLGTTFVGLRADRPPFSDIRLRRAVAAVTGDIAAGLHRFGMHSRPAGQGGLLPPAMPAHDHHAADPPSLDEARALMAEAGHPDGAGLPLLRMVVPKWFGGLDVAVSEALGRLGLEVEYVRSHYGGDFSSHDCHMWIETWIADFPDPEGFFRGLVGERRDRVTDDPEVFSLLERARASREQDERLGLYGQVDTRLAADQAILLPVAYLRTTLLRRPWVSGVWANALTPLRLDHVVVDRAAVGEPAGTI